MKPIYKVIDQELTKRIETELDNVNKYMSESLAKAKEIVPGVSNIAITKCPFRGDHTILGLIFEKGADTSLFKHTNTSGDGSEIYAPKRNSKAAKELDKQLDFIGKNVKLFDESKFEEELGYNPEEREIFDGGYLHLNYLRFGHTKVDGNVVFVYTGYDGYEPNDKAKEITISEYNAMFGR